MPKPFKFTFPAFTPDAGVHVRETRAIHTATSGLLVTESVEYPGAYRLTHETSGMAASRAATRDIFGLLTLAADLAAAGDWTRSAHALANDRDLRRSVKAIVDAADIEWLFFNDNPEHAAASLAAVNRGNN